jgi:hypothetical protein
VQSFEPSTLPHRQLRKRYGKIPALSIGTLPHRQLRKSSKVKSAPKIGKALVHCRTGSLETSNDFKILA